MCIIWKDIQFLDQNFPNSNSTLSRKQSLQNCYWPNAFPTQIPTSLSFFCNTNFSAITLLAFYLFNQCCFHLIFELHVFDMNHLVAHLFTTCFFLSRQYYSWDLPPLFCYPWSFYASHMYTPTASVACFCCALILLDFFECSFFLPTFRFLKAFIKYGFSVKVLLIFATSFWPQQNEFIVNVAAQRALLFCMEPVV